MSFQNPRLWSARTEDEALFLHTGVIGTGWGGTGDLSDLPEDREAFRARLNAAYPAESAAARAAGAGVLYRLAHEVRTGDYVVFVSGKTVHLGVVSGEYAFDGGAAGCEHRRPVRWLRDVPRSAFSREALREAAGSPVALFLVKRSLREFFEALGVAFLEEPRPAVKKAQKAEPSAAPVPAPSAVPASPAPAAVPVSSAVSASSSVSAVPTAAPAPAAPEAARPVLPVTSAVSTDTASYVLDRWAVLAERGELTAFAASLLRAMGYETGADGGGLTASRDPLVPGLRLRVSADGLTVRMDAASYERVFRGAELAELILRYYSALDETARKRIPLRLGYVPAAGDDERRTEVRRS